MCKKMCITVPRLFRGQMSGLQFGPMVISSYTQKRNENAAPFHDCFATIDRRQFTSSSMFCMARAAQLQTLLNHKLMIANGT
jgi:hypothetical protein